MDNFQRNLEKYAEVIVKTGINIQKGQTLVINASIDTAPLARLVVKKAYDFGAKNVLVEWGDSEITLIHLLNAPEETLYEFPSWKAKGYVDMAKEGASFLEIFAPNPVLLKSVDPKRVAIVNKARAKALEEYANYRRIGKVCWSMAAYPSKEWAEKIFPDLNADDGMEKLWENIFMATRVDAEDPVKAWEKHIESINKKLEYFNGRKYKKLHYTAPGTDLYVELPDEQVWIGGGTTSEAGVYFVPNVPTEEIFTMPKKYGVNGTLKSTKPLNYGGNLIEDFAFKFENGKVVDFTAEKGYDTLKTLIEVDEGSQYLGEVALVPVDSPISNSNIIFYNTLFDENASCHFAIGNIYPLCIKNGGKMSKDDFEKNGLNTSLVHVDFMVGCSELDIDGITADGKTEPVFRNGNWAF